MNLKNFIIGAIVGFLIAIAVGYFVAPVTSYNCSSNIQCVASPKNELITKIQKAEVDGVSITYTICFPPNRNMTTQLLTNEITNLVSISFKCVDAAVCMGRGPLKVTSNTLESVSDAQFKALIQCQKQAGDSGNYDCTVTIQSA